MKPARPQVQSCRKFMPMCLSGVPVWLLPGALITYICRPINIITLVMIAGVHALHINLPVVDLVGQGRFQKGFDLQIFDRAALHRQQIVLLVYPAPVNDLTEFLFQNSVQPEPGASAIALRQYHIETPRENDS